MAVERPSSQSTSFGVSFPATPEKESPSILDKMLLAELLRAGELIGHDVDQQQLQIASPRQVRLEMVIQRVHPSADHYAYNVSPDYSIHYNVQTPLLQHTSRHFHLPPKLFSSTFRRVHRLPSSSFTLPLAISSTTYHRTATSTSPATATSSTPSAPALSRPLSSSSSPSTPAVSLSSSSKMPSPPPHTRVAIIGSGPAAHTAAIYLSRAALSPTLYEGMLANGTAAGGQLTTTTDVENYPGFPTGINGSELMDKMREQSAHFGTKIVTETITKLDLNGGKPPFRMWREWEDDVGKDEPACTADAVIVATGANARRLGLPGEEKYWQNGISACAVCDGAVPIFRNKPLVVIGGGDSAAEEAMFLTKYGSKVTVLVRKAGLRASKTMAKRLLANPKVEVRFNTVAVEVVGEEKARGLMTGLRIKDVKSEKEEMMEANGLFYAVGHDPATELVKGQVDTDEDGYILTKPGTSYTSVEGVFAAGDVQDKRYRQAITSAGSGCIAALEAEKYLAEREDDQPDMAKEKDARKGVENGNVVPEYRSNPLL
ncbi:MAG: hypothetical protein Q9227_002448 [Pyrenula ochraceoflavens]